MGTKEKSETGPFKSKFSMGHISGTGNSKLDFSKAKNKPLHPRRQTNSQNRKSNDLEIWYAQVFWHEEFKNDGFELRSSHRVTP